MPVTLSINVSGIDNVLLSFDVLRIKRSRTGLEGVFSLITANAPEPASLVAPTAGDYGVAGKTLQLILDRNPQVDILFTGLAPLTPAQVVDQINVALGAPVASEVANYLQLESVNDGSISVVEIIGGSAAAEFGWAGGERDSGKDAHITLQTDIPNYSYTDQDGERGYYYTAQFYNTVSGLASDDSAPFEGDVGTLVSSSTLSLVKVDLVDARGIAIPDQEITFYPQHDLLAVEGFQVALNRAPITIKTDNSGHAEVSLVRGLRVRVVFEGTSIIRAIQIPDATQTDLLTAMGEAPDPFDIKQLTFPSAIRRTL